MLDSVTCNRPLSSNSIEDILILFPLLLTGTEVTSFELQEKFKWPKAAISNALRESCIEQLQVLLEEAHKSEGARVLNEIEPTDLASYFTRFVETVSSIPSVSLFTVLGDEDDKAFKKLLKMELKLSNEVISLSPSWPLPPFQSLSICTDF